MGGIDMEKARNRTIKMTDSEYETVRLGAIERKLTLGKYIVTACREYGSRSDEISPEVICRLQTIKNILCVPSCAWNERMKTAFDRCVEELCVLLKW